MMDFSPKEFIIVTLLSTFWLKKKKINSITIYKQHLELDSRRNQRHQAGRKRPWNNFLFQQVDFGLEKCQIQVLLRVVSARQPRMETNLLQNRSTDKFSPLICREPIVREETQTNWSKRFFTNFLIYLVFQGALHKKFWTKIKKAKNWE